MRLRDDDGIIIDDNPEPSANGTRTPRPDPTSLFNAPDYTALVKPAQTANAKAEADKVKSLLKAGVIGCINMQDFADAAAILEFGPAFADAAGQFADSNEWAAKGIEILTSPANPAAMFVMTGIPLVAQLFRNHEEAIRELPQTRKQMRLRRKAMRDAEKAQEPRFTIRFAGRKWPVYFRTPRVGKLFSGFRAQTKDPEQLTVNVFSDARVQRALAKQGIRLVRERPSGPQS